MTAYQVAFIILVLIAVVGISVLVNIWVIKTAVREALWEHEKMMASLEKESEAANGPQ